MSNGFAESAFRSSEGSFPAGTLLLHTTDDLAEFESGIGEIVAELTGGLRDIFPQIVILDLAVGERSHEVMTLLDGVGRQHDDNRRGGNAHCLFEIGVPVGLGISLFELLESERIVHRGDISAFLARPGRVGDRSLDLHDVFAYTAGVLFRVAGVHHLSDDKFLIGITYLLVFLVIEEIVVAVAHTETGA